MGKFDEKKFIFHETFTNTNGKQSGSGFAGVILALIAGAAFIAAMVGYFLQIPNTVEVMQLILELVFAAALLLGVRKISPNFSKKTDINSDSDSEPPELPKNIDSKG